MYLYFIICILYFIFVNIFNKVVFKVMYIYIYMLFKCVYEFNKFN